MFNVFKKRVQGPRILIVEDDTYTRSIYETVCTERGFEVIARPDADGFFAEAVEKLAPNIISMDIMIGKAGSATERDGLEAIELLKGDLRTHEIPVFVVSNFFQDAEVKRARALGAVDYLNATGLTPHQIADRFERYLKNPREYRATHPLFREPGAAA